MRTADIEWFLWRPAFNQLYLGKHLTVDQKRGALALALAHRALGHYGELELKDQVHARRLGAQWLISERQIDEAIQGTGGLDPWAMAEYLSVPRNAMMIRLGLVCSHLTNLEVFRRETCGCSLRAAA